MMRLDIFQNQWLALALAGGVVLVLAIVLVCVETWGAGNRTAAPAQPAPETRRMPWFMILIYAATAVFALIYVAMRALAPPNW